MFRASLKYFSGKDFLAFTDFAAISLIMRRHAFRPPFMLSLKFSTFHCFAILVTWLRDVTPLYLKIRKRRIIFFILEFSPFFVFFLPFSESFYFFFSCATFDFFRNFIMKKENEKIVVFIFVTWILCVFLAFVFFRFYKFFRTDILLHWNIFHKGY